MSKQDLILIHAPSVYDFRKESMFYGPVSDLVPSTPVFEMYPFGFTTMAVQLHKAGYKVRIINLASMMLNDRDLDVEKFLDSWILPSSASTCTGCLTAHGSRGGGRDHPPPSPQL